MKFAAVLLMTVFGNNIGQPVNLGLQLSITPVLFATMQDCREHEERVLEAVRQQAQPYRQTGGMDLTISGVCKPL